MSHIERYKGAVLVALSVAPGKSREFRESRLEGEPESLQPTTQPASPSVRRKCIPNVLWESRLHFFKKDVSAPISQGTTF